MVQPSASAEAEQMVSSQPFLRELFAEAEERSGWATGSTSASVQPCCAFFKQGTVRGFNP
jgi:hypothetical protein